MKFKHVNYCRRCHSIIKHKHQFIFLWSHRYFVFYIVFFCFYSIEKKYSLFQDKFHLLDECWNRKKNFSYWTLNSKNRFSSSNKNNSHCQCFIYSQISFGKKREIQCKKYVVTIPTNQINRVKSNIDLENKIFTLIFWQ